MNVTLDKPAPRWSVLAPVKPRAIPHRPAWHATNISETGMFVSGELLLDAGSEVEVDIVLRRGVRTVARDYESRRGRLGA